MFNRYLLPVLAVGCMGFAVMHVSRAQQTPPRVEPPVQPSRVPFAHTVAGSGLVEAQTENIAMGSHLAGVVTVIHVKVGQKVEAGTPLFQLDDRHLRAELKVREASVLSAQAQLARLKAQPRQEELPPSTARMREATENLTDQEDQVRRARTLHGRQAIGEEEMVRREQAFRVAREQLARAKAEYDLLKAGAWQADLDITQAAIALAEAQRAQAQIELDRLVVRALVDGEVLQINVRPGEYVGTPPGQPLVMLGNLRRLHVRVDIDEHDIPRFQPGSPARAVVRGHPRLEHALQFLRVEPYVLPKKSLTGDNTERVDTRVLQVIYAVEAGAQPLYVGQQMDVFVEGTR